MRLNACDDGMSELVPYFWLIEVLCALGVSRRQ